MRTLELFVVWEQRQKPRQKRGRQDKRGRHCRARGALCRTASRRHARRADRASPFDKSLPRKTYVRALRAAVRRSAVRSIAWEGESGELPSEPVGSPSTQINNKTNH